MNMIIEMKFLIVSVIVIVSAVRGEYPSHVPKCKNGDAPCLKNAANEIVQKYSSGIREVNLIRFDPLRVKSIEFERNPSSPVNVGVKFTDLDLIGLKSMEVSSYTGLNTDLNGRTIFEATIPELVLKGHYNIDGRIILLPIAGDGQCEIKCKNIHIKYSYDLKRVEKNGKTYATLEHVKLEMDPENVHVHFDNLFNGDKALGDNMNKFMNANWKDVYAELGPIITKALALVVKSMMNTFFEKYPYTEYFL